MVSAASHKHHAPKGARAVVWCRRYKHRTLSRVVGYDVDDGADDVDESFAVGPTGLFVPEVMTPIIAPIGIQASTVNSICKSPKGWYAENKCAATRLRPTQDPTIAPISLFV